MSRNIYILISESLVGTHSENPDFENIRYFEMKIPVNVNFNIKDSKYKNNTSLQKNSTFLDMLDFYNECQKKLYNVYFLVGFDIDLQGEYMSITLRDNLIRAGIDEKIIFRIPFYEGNYLAVQEFRNIQEFLEYKGIDAEFQREIKEYNKGVSEDEKLDVMSIKKMMSIIDLHENRGKKFKVNRFGNSTFTYLTNKLHNNKTSSGVKDKWIQKIM